MSGRLYTIQEIAAARHRGMTADAAGSYMADRCFVGLCEECDNKADPDREDQLCEKCGAEKWA
jgi:Zn finger protein HypA/HybF involved in hydrogenase expression